MKGRSGTNGSETAEARKSSLSALRSSGLPRARSKSMQPTSPTMKLKMPSGPNSPSMRSPRLKDSPRNKSVDTINVEIRSPRVPSISDQQKKGSLNKSGSLRQSSRSMLNIQRIELLNVSRGSGTTIWKVKLDGWICCMKELDLEVQDADTETFKAEVDVLKSLPSHSKSHLPQYLGFQYTVSKMQLFTSLYQGSLYDLIKTMKQKGTFFETEQIVSYANHLLSALSVLHSRKVLHRDIKSPNIFYDIEYQADEEGRSDELNLILGDFGESKIVEEPESKTVGTPLWMAPEVFKGSYSFPSDIWSLGMVLFEMMSLELPYYDCAQLEVTQSILKGKMPKFPPSVPVDRYVTIMPIFEALLEPNPDHRPSVYEAIARFRNLQTL